MTYKDYEKIADNLKNKINFTPKIAVILGSGLGALADEADIRAAVDFGDIENFPKSTVEGHKGRFVFGYISDVPVVIMQGRVHYYEGYTMEQVVLPVRIMKLLGAEILLLTNAAGGINTDYASGDFMLIRDHISAFVPSPLIGGNADELGVRFPDMSKVYDEELCNIVKNESASLNINIKEGIYVQLSGPCYETPAEVRMLRTLGGDAVGMSTVCEAIAARHCGMRVCGISCISNMACGITDTPLNHKEVQETADRIAPLFKALIKNSIVAFGG